MERAYEITAWDSGYLAIPPALLVWGTDTIASNPLLLNVLLARPASPDKSLDTLTSRRVQWSWQEQLQRWLPWFLALAAALGLVFFFMRWWRNRPVEEVVESTPAAPLEPAHIVALRELDRIEKEAVWKQGHIKAHRRCGEVMRTYFERRYNYPAMERSTDELRSGLVHLPIRTHEKELILELLSLTDLVHLPNGRLRQPITSESLNRAFASLKSPPLPPKTVKDDAQSGYPHTAHPCRLTYAIGLSYASQHFEFESPALLWLGALIALHIGLRLHVQSGQRFSGLVWSWESPESQLTWKTMGFQCIPETLRAAYPDHWFAYHCRRPPSIVFIG